MAREILLPGQCANAHTIKCTHCGDTIGYSPTEIPKTQHPIYCFLCMCSYAEVATELKITTIPHTQTVYGASRNVHTRAIERRQRFRSSLRRVFPRDVVEMENMENTATREKSKHETKELTAVIDMLDGIDFGD